jgi:DNA-binding transcriptional LysR family regulator
MLVESTVRGIGFARLPLFAIQHLIDSGAVRQVLPDFTFLPERGIYAIYPDKRFLPLKVRKFIDLLRARLDESTGAAGA